MTLAERSLESLLPVLYRNSYEQVLEQEVKALREIVKDILRDIKGREFLSTQLLSALEQQVMRVHSGLMNIRHTYTSSNSIDVVVGFEHDLELLSVQKVRTQETTARDLIELKQSFWHYLWLLKQKETELLLIK